MDVNVDEKSVLLLKISSLLPKKKNKSICSIKKDFLFNKKEPIWEWKAMPQSEEEIYNMHK